MTIFFQSDLAIVTENADGEMYLIQSKYIQDVIDDWENKRSFVPSNDARVFFASWNEKPISPYEYTDFESLITYLKKRYNRRRSDDKQQRNACHYRRKS